MPKRTPHIFLRPQNNQRARLAHLLVLFLLLPSQWIPVFANTSPSASAAAGATRSASSSTQTAIHTTQHQTASLVFDLSSTLHNAIAPSHLSQAVSIIEGGVSHSINAGAALTSAERLAVSQVLATGHQSLILSAAGIAAGGTFVLTPGLSSHISGLVIPAGVTALDNVSKTPNISLSGNLTNDGTLVAYASGAVTHAVAHITALSIFNQSSGIITTIMPAALTTRLVNSSPVDVALTATNTLVNAGVISSSGALSIAAGSINNNPAASNIVAAVKPTIQSANDLNIFTSSGNLGNGGTISTTLGNINLTTTTVNNLVVDSTGGIWNASKGYISLGDLLNTNKVDTTVSGGTFNSSALNINSGNGTIDVNANRISAMVNMVGGVAHLTVHDGALELGTLKLSGDPTFYNTGGDLVITSNLNYPGQDLAIIAAGNVLATSGLSSISAADLTIVAGAHFTVTSASPIAGSSSATVPSSNQAAVTDVVSVLGSTATGGNINLTGAAAGLTITTTGSSHSTLIAFNPVNSSSPASDGTNGQVLLPVGSTINNGVYVYSEASAQTSVQLGTVHGGVGIYDKQLMPSTLQFTNGTMTTGSLNTVSNGYLFGTVSLNAVTGGTGNVDIEVGGSATSNISMGDLAVYNQLKLQGNNIEGGAVTFSAPAAQDSILGFGNTVAFVSINPTSGVNTSPFSGQVLVGQDKECMFCSTYPYGTGAVGPAAGGAGPGSVTTTGSTTLLGFGSTTGSGGGAGGITFGSGTGGGFGLAAGSLTGSTSGAITLGTAAFALAAGGTNSASSGGLYFGRTPLDNTPSSGTSGIAFGSGGTSGVAFGSGGNGGGGLSLPSGSVSYWASAIHLGQAILASSTNQQSNANSNYWYNYQWTETAAQPDEPSYYEKAMAMAAISQARADAILKQDQVIGISPGYDFQTAVAAAQQWKNYASIGGSDGGTQASYGVAPQIVQYPGTWLDMIQNSGPTVYNYLPQGFYDWANKYSGGKPITNYTTTESGSAFNPTPPDDSTTETADQNTQKQFDTNNIRDPYTGNLIDSTHLSYDPATGEYVNKDTLQRYNPTTQQWTTDNGDPIQAKYYDQKTQQWVTTNGDPLFKGTALNQPIYDPVTGQAIDRQYLSVSPDGTVTDTRNGNVFSRVSNSWTDADGNAITSLAQIKDTRGNLLDPTKLAVDDSGTITNKANGQTYNPTTGVWTNSNGTVAGFSDGRTVNNPITSKPVDLNDMQYDATTGKVTDVQNNLTYDPKTNVWTNQYGEPLQNIGSVAAHNLAYDFSTHRFTDTSTGNVYDPLLKQWFSPDGNAIPNTPQTIADQGKPANTTINGADGKPLTTDNVLATADVGKVVDTTTNNTFDKTADPGKNWTDQYGYSIGPQTNSTTSKDSNGIWAAQASQTVPVNTTSTNNKGKGDVPQVEPAAAPPVLPTGIPQPRGTTDAPSVSPGDAARQSASGPGPTTTEANNGVSNYDRYMMKQQQLASGVQKIDAIDPEGNTNVSMNKDLTVFADKYVKSIDLAQQAVKAGVLPLTAPGTTANNPIQEAAQRWNYIVVNDGPIRDQRDLLVAEAAAVYSVGKSTGQTIAATIPQATGSSGITGIINNLANTFGDKSQSLASGLGSKAIMSGMNLTEATVSSALGVSGVGDTAKADTTALMKSSSLLAGMINGTGNVLQTTDNRSKSIVNATTKAINQADSVVVNAVNSVLNFHPFASPSQTIVTINMTNRTTTVKNPIYQAPALTATEIIGIAPTTAANCDTNSRDWLPPAAVPIIANSADVQIKTTYGSIYCDRGSATVCLDLGKAVCIYVLESYGKHSVRMFYRNGHTTLKAGKAYLLTDEKEPRIERVLEGTAIPIRNLKTQQSSKRTVVVGDFPIPTALLAVPGMCAKLKSADAETGKIMHNVLKNATILSQLQQSDGAFQPGP